jgi:hypothetical protein
MPLVALQMEEGACERSEHSGGGVQLSQVVRVDGVVVQVFRVTLDPAERPVELYDARGDLSISHGRRGAATLVRIDLRSQRAVVVDWPVVGSGEDRRLTVSANEAMRSSALGNPEERLAELMRSCGGAVDSL